LSKFYGQNTDLQSEDRCFLYFRFPTKLKDHFSNDVKEFILYAWNVARSAILLTPTQVVAARATTVEACSEAGRLRIATIDRTAKKIDGLVMLLLGKTWGVGADPRVVGEKINRLLWHSQRRRKSIPGKYPLLPFPSSRAWRPR
jgi:hypothetical protein